MARGCHWAAGCEDIQPQEEVHAVMRNLPEKRMRSRGGPALKRRAERLTKTSRTGG